MEFFYKVSANVILILAIFFPTTVSAHPGRTDAYGCHTCHTNCAKWGLGDEEYHCHNAKALPQPLPPVTSHKTGVTEPAPRYVRPVVQPAAKTAPVVEKPIVKTVPAIKSIATSTSSVEQKSSASTPAKESWWKKIKGWFQK